MEDLDLNNQNELFDRIAEGSESAFNNFYNTLLPDFTAYIFKMVKSEDAVKEIIQESLVRFWLHRDKLAGVQYPRAWFFKIVSNECYRYLRKHGLRQIHIETYQKEAYVLNAEQTHVTEMDVSFRETQRIIHEAVAQLSPRQRTVYQLSRGEGMTLEQIAGQLGVSRDYVKKTLMFALQIIRKELIKAGRWLILLMFLNR